MGEDVRHIRCDYLAFMPRAEDPERLSQCTAALEGMGIERARRCGEETSGDISRSPNRVISALYIRNI